MRGILPPFHKPLYGVVFKYKYKCNLALFELLSNLDCTYKIILVVIKWLITGYCKLAFEKIYYAVQEL